MSSFEPAYLIVARHEGGYVFDPLDTGGETYKGIARRIWSSWDGWTIIDFEKKTGTVLQTNDLIDNDYLDMLVEDFYRDRWNASRAGSITSQKVANAYFDLYILSSKAVETMQLALRRMGKSVTADNRMGSQTLSAINSVDPDKLLAIFTDERIEFHHEMVNAGIVSEKFLKGWIKRATNFSDPYALNWYHYLTAGSVVATVLYLYHHNQKNK
jgi:lysozyme family protein